MPAVHGDQRLRRGLFQMDCPRVIGFLPGSAFHRSSTITPPMHLRHQVNSTSNIAGLQPDGSQVLLPRIYDMFGVIRAKPTAMPEAALQFIGESSSRLNRFREVVMPGACNAYG